MCAVQFSPSTYILLLYTHAHVYIESFRAKRAPTNVYFSSDHGNSQLLFRIHIIIPRGSACSEFISCGFFFYDRFNRKVFTYYYYHRMCAIRISSCIIILYRSLRSAKSHHRISSYRKSRSCFACGAVFFENCIQNKNKIYHVVSDATAYLYDNIKIN